MEFAPEEISLRVASFLSIPDVLSYQSTCKNLRNVISLNRLDKSTPIQIRDLHGNDAHGCNICLWERIEQLLFRNLTHTVILTCDYEDQGWGNRKGRIFITAFSPAVSYGISDIGSIVATSPMAEHELTKCTLQFHPEPGYTYAICYKVGGGGGHKLFAYNFQLRSAIHSPCATLAHKLVLNLPDLFFMNMIRASLDNLSENDGADQYNSFYSLFRSVGIDLTNELNIEHLRTMLQEVQQARNWMLSN